MHITGFSKDVSTCWCSADRLSRNLPDCSLQDRTHTLKSFASSADWIKSLHFGDPKPTADPGVAAERSSKRRKLGSYTGPEPTVEEIEGEFWRVIEAPDDVRLMSLQHLSHLMLPHAACRSILCCSQTHVMTFT